MATYEHDCEECRYLGSFERVDGEPLCNAVDGWAHHYDGRITVIRRYSSDGPDYACWTVFPDSDTPMPARYLPLWEALPGGEG